MRRIKVLAFCKLVNHAGLGFFTFFTPALFAQSDHVELGVLADYFDLSRTTPHINSDGVGGRADFNVNPNVQILAGRRLRDEGRT